LRRGKGIRSKPAENPFPKAESMTTRTLGSEFAFPKTETVWRINLKSAALRPAEGKLLIVESIQRLRPVDLYYEKSV
jgi:hypothetical protein